MLNKNKLWVADDPCVDKKSEKKVYKSVKNWKKKYDLPTIADLLGTKMIISNIAEDQE